jgi:hypothetical protein
MSAQPNGVVWLTCASLIDALILTLGVAEQALSARRKDKVTGFVIVH